MLTVCLGSLLPSTMAATKYNYIANGEKDILGFKVSGIVQKEECDSIEIILSANKNIVEFSTYQDVIYNGTTYTSGNHTIDSTKKVAFIYSVKGGESLSPIIIYLERIENTSCPLEIRYCKDDAIVEKVNMTLVATFYANQASDLRENKENSSGSLVQEDVIISRPNTPTKPVEPTEPVEPPVTEPDEPDEPTTPVTPPVEECKHTETKVVNAKEATVDEEGYTGDTVCVKCNKEIAKGTKIDKLPSTPSDEVELPIVDTTTPPVTDPPIDETEPPVVDDPITPPTTDPVKPNPPVNEDTKGIFDFINSIPKTYIYVAIGGVGFLLAVVIILIIVLGSKKKKDTIEVEQVPVNVPPMPPTTPEVMQEPVQEQIPDPIPVAPVIEENPDLLIDDDLLFSTPAEEVTEEKPVEETIPATPVMFTDPEPVVEEQPIPEIPIIDEYNEIMMATLPASEIEKIKHEFESSDDNGEDEYSNIIM